MVIRYLLRHESLRVVVIVIWLVTFGGNIQKPVVSFFFQDLGMTAVQIGHAGLIVSTLVLLTGPGHGFIMDTFGAFTALNVTLSFCGIGCFLRGIATSANGVYFASAVLGFGSNSLATISLATISRALPPKQRCLSISSFLLQLRLISLATRFIYPFYVLALTDVLHVHDTMLRYRISMQVCAIPCLIGFLWLLSKYQSFSELEKTDGYNSDDSLAAAESLIGAAPKDEEQGEQEQDRTRSSLFDSLPQLSSSSAAEHSSTKHALSPAQSQRRWIVLSLCLVFNSFATHTLLLLWPLYMRRHFGWADSQYAVLLLASGIVSAVVLALCSAIETRVGSDLSRITAALISAVGTTCFFLQENVAWVRALHVILALLLVAGTAYLDPSLQAGASLCWPKGGLGRSFGAILSLSSLGGILANLCSAPLYQASIDDPTGKATGGALPMVLTCVLLLTSSALLLTQWRG